MVKYPIGNNQINEGLKRVFWVGFVDIGDQAFATVFFFISFKQ